MTCTAVSGAGHGHARHIVQRGCGTLAWCAHDQVYSMDLVLACTLRRDRLHICFARFSLRLLRTNKCSYAFVEGAKACACHCGRQKHVIQSDRSTCSQSFPDSLTIQIARRGDKCKARGPPRATQPAGVLRKRLHPRPRAGGGHTELLGELVGGLGPVRERVEHADLLQAVQGLRSAGRKSAGPACSAAEYRQPA